MFRFHLPEVAGIRALDDLHRLHRGLGVDLVERCQAPSPAPVRRKPSSGSLLPVRPRKFGVQIS